MERRWRLACGRTALGATVVSALAVFVLAQASLQTTRGQLLDAAVLEGSRRGQLRLAGVAGTVLEAVSVTTLVAVMVLAMLVAAARKRPWQLLQAGVVLAGSNLTTQLLKHSVFDVTPLIENGPRTNSLPSGHTTVAASVAVSLLLVVPARWRATVALAGALITAAMGWSTLAQQWHRPSDVVAAVLVVLVWTGAACLLVPMDAPDVGFGTGGVVRLLLVAAAVTTAAAALAVAGLGDIPFVPGMTRRQDLLAYGAGTAAVVAAATGGFAAVLWLRDRAELRDRAQLTAGSMQPNGHSARPTATGGGPIRGGD